jgi:hypothetical protein
MMTLALPALRQQWQRYGNATATQPLLHCWRRQQWQCNGNATGMLAWPCHKDNGKAMTTQRRWSYAG